MDFGLTLLEGFLNTVEHDGEPDLLADVDGLARWAGAHGRAARPGSRTDLARARALRAALRDALRTPTAPSTRGRLAAACRPYPLRAGDPTAGEDALVPVGSGTHAAVGRIAAAIAVARAAGTFERLKVCPGDGCGYAFVDRSRNRSRRWCAMTLCGNQSKVRTYRAGRRAVAAGLSPEGPA